MMHLMSVLVSVVSFQSKFRKHAERQRTSTALSQQGTVFKFFLINAMQLSTRSTHRIVESYVACVTLTRVEGTATSMQPMQ